MTFFALRKVMLRGLVLVGEIFERLRNEKVGFGPNRIAKKEYTKEGKTKKKK